MPHSYQRLTHRIAAIAAFIAIIFCTLAPSVSYILAAQSGKSLITICSSFGIRTIKVDFKNKNPKKHDRQTQHCPFCITTKHYPFIPPSDNSFFLPIQINQSGNIERTLAYLAAFLLYISAQPRAPPFFS